MWRFVIVLMLYGCAQWKHPTKSEQEFHADAYECERDAAAVRDRMYAMEMRKRCMRTKGWADSY